jgi:hypothetical protein
MTRFTTLLAIAALTNVVDYCKGAGSKPDRCRPPAAPTGLASTSRSTTAVALAWTAPATPHGCAVTGYAVLDAGAVVGTSTTTSLALQGLAPNTAHAFTVVAVNRAGRSAPSAPLRLATLPDLGPNSRIYDPTMAMSAIQADIDAVYAPQFSDVTGQFDTSRYALLFQPGQYQLRVPVGYYMQVLGLGALPDDTTITGVVTSYGHWSGDWGGSGYNATQNFWRGLENFAVVPTDDTAPLPAGTPNTLGATGQPYMRWAVSQACPFRRMHVQGDLALNHWSGWASGGWMSDSKIDGEVGSGSQQQWITRNSSIGSWSNVNWNHVFLGVDHPYVDLFEKGWAAVRTTIVDRTPRVREKPFLHVDARGDYFVFVPALQSETAGPTWASTPTPLQTPGLDHPLTEFFVARPGDAVADINAALAAGKHLLLTPGIYHLDATLEVTRPGTIVLGIGMATLHPDTGLPAMTVADVDGVTLAGLLFDAGTVSSPVLLRVGPDGATTGHRDDPTLLADVFMRVGGAEDGKAEVGLVINSHDVIGDHFWIWRADHGTAAAPTGWTLNPSRTGLVVNGDGVTVYGLFVEHFQEYQTRWNGEGGRVYFYQSEDPYDVPDQPSWTSHGGAKNGWASYQVADAVTDHEAWGLGVYSVFNVFPAVQDSSIEVPVAAGVKLHHMVNYGLAQGTITHVVNDVGGPAANGPWDTNGAPVVEYPVPVIPPPPAPAALVFPLNWESTPNARYGFPTWGSGIQFGVVHDPDDASNHLLGFQRAASSDAWAGFSVDGGDTDHWLATNPLDVARVFTLRIRCDHAGVPVLLKLENPADGNQYVQVAATTGPADGWQTLTFDFTGAAVAAGVPYTRLDLFPGFDGQSGSGAVLCYLDDLAQAP